MTITSTAFQNGEEIPAEYGYNSRDTNPPLTFSEVPKKAKSLLLTVEDPDAPSGTFTHWILYNIAPATLQVMEGKLPINAVAATNDFGQQTYGGPKPPSGKHRYEFILFALDTTLDVQPTAKRDDIYAAMKSHVIDQTQLTGIFAA